MGGDLRDADVGIIEAGQAGQVVDMGHHLALVCQGVAAVLGPLQEGLQQPGLLFRHGVLPNVPLQLLQSCSRNWVGRIGSKRHLIESSC